LRSVTKQEYTNPVAPSWTPKTQGAWENLKGATLFNPSIQHFDHRKLIVLQMVVSSLGIDFIFLQPGNDKAPTKAAQDYWDGCSFSLMMKDSIAALHLVCFGTCHT
jgi:hypothetical protein